MLSDLSTKHAPDAVKKEAAYQVMAVGIISALPLIVALIFAFDVDQFFRVFANIVFSGPLYLYATSVCASTFYVSRMDFHKQNSYTNLIVGLFILVVIALTAAHISLSQEDKAKNFLLHATLSTLIFATAIWIYYLAIVRSQSPPPDIQQSNRAESDKVLAASEPRYD